MRFIDYDKPRTGTSQELEKTYKVTWNDGTVNYYKKHKCKKVKGSKPRVETLDRCRSN